MGGEDGMKKLAEWFDELGYERWKPWWERRCWKAWKAGWGPALRWARTMAGIGVREMARRMGKDWSWVSKVERNQLYVNDERVDRWLAICGVKREVAERFRVKGPTRLRKQRERKRSALDVG